MNRLRKDDPRAFLSPAKPPEEFAADVAVLRALLNYCDETGLFTWTAACASPHLNGRAAGTVNVKGYRRIEIGGRSYAAHRLAFLFMTGAWPCGEVDHINCNRGDNRFENLRVVDRKTNTQNRRYSAASSITGLLGVVITNRKIKPYRSVIFDCGRQVHLGYFALPEEAHRAYLNAKRRLHEGCTL